METKFVAGGAFTYLGKIYDTKEEAQRAARGMDYELDAKTGYSSAFNCDPIEESEVTEIEIRPISAEEYMAMEVEKKEAEKKFKSKISQMRKEFYAKYDKFKYAYINLNTTYNYNDTIRLTTRRPSGRKRILEGQVCGILVTDTGEIRPDLRGMNYPVKEPILSIEVIACFEGINVRQRVVCKNCKHWKRNPTTVIGKEEYRSSFGYCSVHDKEISDYHKNEYDCYENDPEAERLFDGRKKE